MINWKVRLKNKTFLVTFLIAVIGFIYNALEMAGIMPRIGQGAAENIIMNAVNLLVLLGIVIDPTTKGVSDCDTVLNQGTKKSTIDENISNIKK